MTVSSAAELAGEFEDRGRGVLPRSSSTSRLSMSRRTGLRRSGSQRVTHSGPLAVDDDVVLEPTGVRCSLHGVTVAEFEGDRIRSFRQYWDEAEVLAQIGLLTDD